MTGLFEARVTEVLSGPSSLYLAAIGEEGPVSSRPHGVRVVEHGCLRVPVRVAAMAPVLRAARAGRALALVAADITDFTSFQLKGRPLRLERATDEDRARGARYVEGLVEVSERVVGLPRARNFAFEPDAVLVVRVDEVFQQTPGRGAGSRLTRREDVPPPAPPDDQLGPFPEEPEPPPPLLTEPFLSSLDGTIPPALITAGPGEVPNVSHLSKLELLSDDTLAASRQFFKKTAANLARDPRALALTLDAHTNRSFALRLRHERTETDGPVFERMRARLDAIASLVGMTEVFRLVGADIFRLEEAAEMPGLLSETAA